MQYVPNTNHRNIETDGQSLGEVWSASDTYSSTEVDAGASASDL